MNTKLEQLVNKVALAIAFLLAWAAAAPALTINDPLTSATNWGPQLASPDAGIGIGGGRMNYTATTTADTGGAGIPRVAMDLLGTNVLSPTQDWSLKVDAHLASSIAHAINNQFGDVFLGFGKTGGWFTNHVTFEFGSGFWGNPIHNGYYVEDDITINGVEVSSNTRLFENWSITSPDVALRMDYSAANQAVTFYLDADGATGGYNWVAQGTASLASGTYNLNLSPTDTFTIFLLGSSGYQNIVADQAYLSGLVITVSSAPIVTTGAATAITTTAATLNGTVNPNGLATTAKFEYGLTTAYGSSTNVALSPNNGVAAQAVSAMLTGLQAGLTYHYRLTATNGDGTALGNDATFATASLPPQLDITRAGPQFLLSWLTNCPGFVVETTSNLSVGTVWQIVTNAVTISDNRFWVTNPPVSKPAFYRLRLQISNPVPAGMALIPAGPFVMGDTFSEGERYELPLHTVYVSAFYMDMNLVSYALWQEVYNWAITNGYSFDNAGAGKAANHPAQSMTWYDAVKWCNARSEKEGRVPAYYMEVGLSVRYRTGQVNVQTNWVNWSAGYRLPTEAEWEKTARGGASGQRFPWGNTISWSQANYYIIWPGGMSYWPYDVNPTSGYNPAWTSGGQPYTTPVGSFAANGYGLYDMAGNVYQWCWDWWASGGAYPSSSQTDPRGPASGYTRVIRGGGWFDGAYACRAAYREYYSPTSSYSGMGFRSVLPPGQ